MWSAINIGVNVVLVGLCETGLLMVEQLPLVDNQQPLKGNEREMPHSLSYLFHLTPSQNLLSSLPHPSLLHPPLLPLLLLLPHGRCLPGPPT